MVLAVILSIFIEFFYILLHLLEGGSLVLQVLGTHGFYLGLKRLGEFECLATPLFVLNLEGGAYVWGGKFGSRLDVLVEGLADVLQIFGVGYLDLNAFAEGVDEVLHLFAHGLKVLDYVLGMGLRW